MKPVGVFLLLLPFIASCACRQDWVNAKDYQQIGDVGWGEPVNGLQIGTAPIASKTPLPWFDFQKIYLRNVSDKPLQILNVPDLLTNEAVMATSEQEGTTSWNLLELSIRDEVSGRNYFVYAVPQYQAKPLVLMPGQDASMLVRINLSLPQQPNGNHYSTVWSYHVRMPLPVTQAASESAWSGDIQTWKSETTVN